MLYHFCIVCNIFVIYDEKILLYSKITQNKVMQVLNINTVYDFLYRTSCYYGTTVFIYMYSMFE